MNCTGSDETPPPIMGIYYRLLLLVLSGDFSPDTTYHRPF